MSKADKAIDLVEVARQVVEQNGFRVDLPADADRTIPSADPDRGGVDLRDRPWSSIDNDESRDLDQIEVAERMDGDRIRVLIAIADVDALVPRGSPIDQLAAHNTTSLYTGIRVFPMLPEALSTGRTSLLEGEDRLAVVTEMVVLADGSLDDGATRIYSARVRNRAKLTYDAVGAWLEAGANRRLGEHPAEIADQVRLHDQAAQRLRRRRFERGALELETIEARPVARDGEIVDLEVAHKNRARELVEDLMIAANGATARYLEARGFASIRRVVRAPRRWPRIVELARELGAELPAEPSAPALAGFLAERRRADPARYPDLSLSVVKLLGPGEYAVQRAAEPDQGHFGLAVEDYAHSTAPNRRYADLVTQRLLLAAAAAAPTPYTDDELVAIAARCTEREDAARKVERTMRKVGAAVLLSSRVGETFDAIVTGATGKGTFVRLIHPPAEGRVVSGEGGLDVGDPVRVRLLATEPLRGFIDFAAVAPPP
ncbi:MAG TPA: RNB domain-containing ribonuclease [Kofleriaceae bacterium]|nr:RNB domain-containing ribonuclease [Kofleriaceae bacterium]